METHGTSAATGKLLVSFQPAMAGLVFQCSFDTSVGLAENKCDPQALRGDEVMPIVLDVKAEHKRSINASK
jgi:hypothetical protein